jgi:hypothetical protein
MYHSVRNPHVVQVVRVRLRVERFQGESKLTDLFSSNLAGWPGEFVKNIAPNFAQCIFFEISAYVCSLTKALKK